MSFLNTKAAISVILGLLLLLAACGDDSSNPTTVTPSIPDTLKVRAMHLSYDAPAVDVFLGGSSTATFNSLAYGSASDYVKVDAGTLNVQMRPTGSSQSVIDFDAPLEDERLYTFYALGPVASIEGVFTFDERGNSNNTKIRMIHAVPDAPALDFELVSALGRAGATNFVGINKQYRDVTFYADVERDSYWFALREPGELETFACFSPVLLDTSKAYTLVLHGTADTGDNFPFRATLFDDSERGAAAAFDLTPAPPKAKLRVLHAFEGAPSVTATIDTTVSTIINLFEGESSGYLEVTAGTKQVKIAPVGSSDFLVSANVPFALATDYTLIVTDSITTGQNNSDSTITSIFFDSSGDERVANSGSAKLRLAHGSYDAPAVDLRAGDGNGPVLFSNSEFGSISDYATVAPGDYGLALTPAGSSTEVLLFEPISLMAGDVFTAVAYGTLNSADSREFKVGVFSDLLEGELSLPLTPSISKVLVFHASPDAGQVTLVVDGITEFNDSLGFEQNTGYLDLNSGDRNLQFTSAAITPLNSSINLDRNKNYTLFAANTAANFEPVVVEDDFPAVVSDTTTSFVRFAHFSPDAPNVDIVTGGTVLFSDVAFKEAKQFIEVPSAAYDLEVRVTGTSNVVLNLNGVMLEGTRVYTVVATGEVGNATLKAVIVPNN
ncbi:MAG: DUF4397 domain-containing protein [Calditrichota bacterium]